jgi:hypothetical protein
MATPATTSAPLSLPPLPYAESALEPVSAAGAASLPLWLEGTTHGKSRV